MYVITRQCRLRAKIDCPLSVGMLPFGNLDSMSARGRVATVISLKILQI
jgi:hypothetical protein